MNSSQSIYPGNASFRQTGQSCIATASVARPCELERRPIGVPTSAINISSCISGVLQHLKDARVARRSPEDVMRRWPGEWSHRQQQVGFLKMAHYRLGAAKLAKLGKQMEQPRLHLLIGIEGNPAIPAIG